MTEGGGVQSSRRSLTSGQHILSPGDGGGGVTTGAQPPLTTKPLHSEDEGTPAVPSFPAAERAG